MPVLTTLGNDGDRGSVWEGDNEFFGMLNLRPEEYTGIHGYTVTLIKNKVLKFS